ncbi:hypothetical protein PF010_g13655 [Phytophthora fragariae]|uniref:DDE Tnp4 domain-containing protein n=1 Tax=Phytophthora fragariae TaxID=53985 RepID=A0A6G0KZ82_9STRA|nr:hypothetical protein PF010_g13655 [Phytophthora fragariae]
MRKKGAGHMDPDSGIMDDHEQVLYRVCRHMHNFLVAVELKSQMRVGYRLLAACFGLSHLSAWTLLCEYGTNENLLNVTTLTRAAFEKLLARFPPFYTIDCPGRKDDRPSKLQYYHQVLGQRLHCYEGSMGLKTLGEVLAVPPTTLQRTVARA